MSEMSLDDRINRLERTVRTQRTVGLGLLFLALVQCGASRPEHAGFHFRELDGAGQLEVLDAELRPRIVLSAAGSPRIALLDPEGREAVALLSDLPSVMVNGAGASARVYLSAQADGGMVMSCDSQERCAQLFAQGDARGVLVADGDRTLRVVQRSDSSQLEVVDGEEQVRLGVWGGDAGVSVSGDATARVTSGQVDVLDADGVVRARMSGEGTVGVAPSGRVLRPLD